MSRNKIAATIEIGIATSPLLTFAETRQVLRCSARTLFRLYKGYRKPDGAFKRAELCHVRRGGSVLFLKSDVEKYLTARHSVV
jgi:hypothetical protein